MQGPHPYIFLASRSSRRRELLRQIGVHFETLLLRDLPPRGPDVDEEPHPGEAVEAYVLRVTRDKAAAGFDAIKRRGFLARPVLAADTTVAIAGRILGKPRDAADAERMLLELSGRTHRVLTAVAVGLDGEVEELVSESEVDFDNLDPADVARYAASGEPMDKAGAYGIQGRAAVFVKAIRGSYSGIMGLPLHETALLLRRFGVSLP